MPFVLWTTLRLLGNFAKAVDGGGKMEPVVRGMVGSQGLLVRGPRILARKTGPIDLGCVEKVLESVEILCKTVILDLGWGNPKSLCRETGFLSRSHPMGWATSTAYRNGFPTVPRSWRLHARRECATGCLARWTNPTGCRPGVHARGIMALGLHPKIGGRHRPAKFEAVLVDQSHHCV
jgi:hypothetical protein